MRWSFLTGRHARSNAGRGFPVLALLVLALGLASCGSLLSPGPPPTRLRLSPAMPGRLAERALDKQLIVSLPYAGSDIDTDNIALLFNGRELRYLSGVRWTSSVPHLVQRALIDALIASNAFRGVSDESAGIFANVKLLADIRQFVLRYADPKAPPTAVISVTFSLVNLANGEILGTKQLTVETPAGGVDTPALVTACETALSRCLASVTPWIISTAAGKKRSGTNSF